LSLSAHPEEELPLEASVVEEESSEDAEDVWHVPLAGHDPPPESGDPII